MKKRENRDWDGAQLRCPVCGSFRLQTKETRSHRASVRRRRSCFDCDYRFFTAEVWSDRDCNPIEPDYSDDPRL